MIELRDSTSPAGRYQPLVWLLAALCGGMVLDRYAPQPFGIWWLACAVLCGGWLLTWLCRRDRIAAIILLLAAASLGAGWHHFQWRLFAQDEIARFSRDTPQPVCLTAVARTGVRRTPAPPYSALRTIPKGDQSRLELEVTGIRDGGRWIPARGACDLIVDGHLLDVQAGDRLEILGQLDAPAPPGNPGELDFADHYRAEGKLCVVRAEFPDSIEIRGRGSPLAPARMLDGTRGESNRLLARHIDERRAPLASAILLGSREELDQERTEDFFTTGSIHLLAISGLHVGILVTGFWIAARIRLLRRSWALLAAAVFVVLYALLTDARPPVVRATILVIAFCGSLALGRAPAALNSLAAAGIFIAMLAPPRIFQTGTQLSFLAVATLIACGPLLMRKAPADPLDRLLARARSWPARMIRSAAGWLLRLTLAGTAVWLVALPLVVYRFQIVTPVAVLLNPLLWIPIAVALFSGFGVLVFGPTIPPLADACGWLCDQSLACMEWQIGLARPLPGSHFYAPGPPLWWVIGFYSGLAAWLLFPRLRPPRRWMLAGLGAVAAVGFFSTPGAFEKVEGPREELACTFVDVGDGTCAIVELPDGRTLLYDAGSQRSPESGARSIAAVLWSRGITHLDAVVISHADADHFNALPELLERFSVAVVYVSPVMFEADAPSLAALREAIGRAGVPIREISSADPATVIGAVRLSVLHPPEKGVVGRNDNVNSIVLALEFEGRRLLLPGDLESPGLDDLLAEEPLDCDVVMAPHHGSAGSNPQGFAAWSSPEHVVISGGSGRDVSPVQAAYGAAGAEVHHTAKDGAVRVTLARDGVSVRGWRQSPW